MKREKIGNLILKFSRREKVPQTDYLTEGDTPVVDQSSGTLVVGYTNNPDARHESPLPVIVFGDHTRVVKRVDFPFASGADGTQLLYPNRPDLDPTYFYYAIQNVDLSNYFYARHFKFLKEEEIALPPVAVQQRIASVLTAYDDLMENNRRRMALLEESARLLYREWFVRLRFPGHERARIVSGIPVGWRSTTIGAFIERGLIELQTGPFGTQLKASHYTETGAPVINVRNIGYGDIRADKLEFVPDEVRDRLEVHVLKAGDIVFGRKGAVDRHVLVTSAQEGWVQGSDCIRLRVLSDEVSPVLLSFAFREENHHAWMLNQCGNKATMASLNQDVVSRISIIAADTQVQRDFQDFATDVLKQIANLALQNQKLRTARDHLLPRLMSGELAV